MYRPLVPCPSCWRHVQTTETACPFCAAALPAGLDARAVPRATKRLGRAAAFVFGASVATGAAAALGACSGEVTDARSAGGFDDGVGGSGDDGGAQTLYGAPAPDAGSEDAAPEDDGGGQALYGAPAPDAGPDDDAGPEDAGPDDDGGNADLYGSPPP